MNKKKIIAISVVLTVILWSVLVYAERKAVNFTPKTTVIMSLKTIDEGVELSESDFIEKSVDIDLATLGAIKSKADIKGKFALETIYPNEIVNKNRVVDKNNPNNTVLEANQREFSIPASLLDDPYAGTLRGKDKVDILFTNAATPNNPSRTQPVVKQGKIIGAIDSSGKLLLPSDKNILSAAVIFSGTLEEAAKVANLMYTGKFKLIKVSLNSNDSKDIIIQEGKVVK